MSGGVGCNRGAPPFAVADHNFKQESLNVYPAREGRGMRWSVETEQQRTGGGQDDADLRSDDSRAAQGAWSSAGRFVAPD
jgi:hypothetical protein